MSKDLKEKIALIADKMTEYSLYAVAFFIPISIGMVESFVCFLLLGFIIKKIILPDFSFIKSRINFFLLIFLIFCGLSLLNSGSDIDKSLNALFFKWGQYILIFFMVQDTLVSGKRIRNTLAILIYVGCLVALDGFSQRFIDWEFFRGKQIGLINENLKAVTGPFKHYNSLAAYLVCILTLFISVIFTKKKEGRVVYGVPNFLLFLLAGCLFLTFSRGAWVGFLFACLLMLFLSRRWKFILPLLGFFMLALLAPGIRERVLGGDSGRFSVWSGACGMIKEHPFFGVGIGTFMSNFSKYTKGLGVQYAHNCYLQIWAETGIFALLSFLGFVIAILSQGIKSFIKTHDYIALGLSCAIFGFLAHSFFDNHLYSLQLAVLFWFLAGMLIASNKKQEI